MKVLWITNILFAHHREMIGLPVENMSGGSWLYAAYEGSKNSTNLQLHIATVGDVQEIKCSQKDNSFFYILPGGNTPKYDIHSEKNEAVWQKLREIVNPDAVIAWGTEKPFTYVGMKAMTGVPIAIYIQGVIESICEHYYEGVPVSYRCRTVRDWVDRLSQTSQIRKFWTQRPLEREMLKIASAVIIENDWCEDQCKRINPQIRTYQNLLPIREEFYSNTWSLDTCERKTVFTNAGGYPIKGHHILFRALSIVKQVYPDFKCYIPGPRLNAFMQLKRRTGYMSYLKKLITENRLEENIVYVGNLSSKEMANYITRCNVFVMPSIVENHSSSLIEAMSIGAPCISSLVGGTASLVSHSENGLLYNSLDAASLAGCIIRVFGNDILATTLSKGASFLRNKRPRDFGSKMSEIYTEVIKAKM